MSTRLAQFISHVFDPLPTTVVIGLIGIFSTTMSQSDRLSWLGLIGALTVLIGLILAWFMRRGYVFDAKLTHDDDLHRDRLGILWITDGLLTLAVFVSAAQGQQQPLWSILVAMTIVLVIATLITTQYKVSLHMVGVASLVTLLIILFWPVGFTSLILLPIVAWARRVLHRHTLAQLITGTIVATVSIVVVFALTGQLVVIQ